MVRLTDSATDSILTPALLEAWRPPRRLSASQWAEEHVELSPDSPMHGPLHHRNAPYLPGIIDLVNRPGVWQVNVRKAGQIGVSEAMRWLIGYWAQMDPSSTGLTLPDKIKGRKIVKRDVVPFFRRTPPLRRLSTKVVADETQEQIALGNGFVLHLMWAGSASSTASFPIRYVINDEVDKMQAWGRGGGEGHAVHRTRTRSRVYGDRARQVNVSTPTYAGGMIQQLYELSDLHLCFIVPCPRCRKRIALIWPQVKFKHGGKQKLPPQQWAQMVREEEAAWYECQACGKKFRDRERRRAVQRGRWGTVDENYIADGQIDDALAVERFPPKTSIGLWIPAWYCTWETMANIAAEWILAQGDTTRLFTWVTETAGEPFERQLSRVRAADISGRAEEAALPEGRLPTWTASLIGVFDTQHDHFWGVIRAWGPGRRSARVWHGRVDSFADIERLCLEHPWPFDGDAFPPALCDLALIDSGGTRAEGAPISRTMDVYAWVLRHPEYVRAIRGDSSPRPGIFYRRGRGWYEPAGGGSQKIEVPLWLLDVHHWQDELAAMMDARVVVGQGEDGEPIDEPLWQLNQRDDPVYDAHMSNLRKTAVPNKGQLVERWVPVTGGARVDLRHCEGYQVAAAYMRQVHLLPSLEDYMAMRRQSVGAAAPRPAGGITAPDGRSFVASRD